MWKSSVPVSAASAIGSSFGKGRICVFGSSFFLFCPSTFEKQSEMQASVARLANKVRYHIDGYSTLA